MAKIHSVPYRGGFMTRFLLNTLVFALALAGDALAQQTSGASASAPTAQGAPVASVPAVPNMTNPNGKPEYELIGREYTAQPLTNGVARATVPQKIHDALKSMQAALQDMFK